MTTTDTPDTVDCKLDFHHRTVGLERYWYLGYWVVLGDIHRHWIVLLLRGYSVPCDTQYDADQTAVGIVHMITILTSVVRPLSADDGREGVKCKLYSGQHV